MASTAELIGGRILRQMLSQQPAFNEPHLGQSVSCRMVPQPTDTLIAGEHL